MDFVCKLYGNTYAVHVTVALVGVATLNLALPPPPPVKSMSSMKRHHIHGRQGAESSICCLSLDMKRKESLECRGCMEPVKQEV